MHHASGQEPWNQWRGSIGHTGVSSGSVPSEGKLLWRYKTEGQVQSSPVFYDGNVIIGSDDGRLYCLDGPSGDLLWKFPANDSIQATALIRGNRAYFGSLDGIFYCISLPDASSGEGGPKELWRYDCGAAIVSSAHALGDSVLFGCHDGALYRLSTEGDLIWRADLGWSEIWASPLIDSAGGRVFIGNIIGEFSCVELADGNVTWTVDAGEIYSSGCLVSDVIYLSGGVDERLHAINAADGSKVWDFHPGYATYSTPSVSDGRVFFGSWEHFWCVPAEDPNSDGEINASEVTWSAPTYEYQGGSSAVVAEDYVYVGSDDGNLYCFEKDAGSLVWNYTTGGYVYSSPALHEGLLYFGSCDDYVYCLGELPPRLYTSFVSSADEILSNETVQFTVTVLDENGTAVPEAVLDIVLSSGEIQVITGVLTDENQVVCDSNGRAVLLFVPPPVSSRSTVEITVTAEKGDIQPGQEVWYITVEPGAQEASGKTQELVDPNEKRIPFYTFLMCLIITDVLLAYMILRLRRKGAENGTRSKRSDGGDRIEK